MRFIARIFTLILVGLIANQSTSFLSSAAVTTVSTLPFTSTMDVDTPTTWIKSDGWGNGAPFNVGWRADHIAFTNGFLTLQLDDQPSCATTPLNCSSNPYSSAEYKTIFRVSYGKIVFRAKPVAATGVVTGLFLYTGPSDNQQHDEIDIEFLGKDTTGVQFNFYTNGVGGNEFWFSLGFDASLAFHDYSIEWLPGIINWYVDGVIKHSALTTPTITIPTFTQHIFLNFWAAKGVDNWTGPFVYSSPLVTSIDSVSYTPVDTTPPVITLSGGDMTLAQNGVFADAGYSAADNVDGNLTAKVKVSGAVDSAAAVGTVFTITYDVYDAAGNAAIQKARSITITAPLDTTPPVITLLGHQSVTILMGTSYKDSGATANDNADGNISGKVIANSNVSINTSGTYLITYNVSDSAGNAAQQITRTVIVIKSRGAAPVGSTMRLPAATTTGSAVDIYSVNGAISNAATLRAFPPRNVVTPFGAVDYTTTVPSGKTDQVINITYTDQLPPVFDLYKIDGNNRYSLISKGAGVNQWQQIDRYSISVRIKDGGMLDQDGVIDGIIVDPVAVGVSTVTTTSSASTSTVAVAPGKKSGGCIIGNGSLLFVVLLLIPFVFKSRN